MEAVVKGQTLENLAANAIADELFPAEGAKLRYIFGVTFCLEDKPLTTLMTQLQALSAAQQ
eukprot:2876207-Pyramimonas_sp.AAC.1